MATYSIKDFGAEADGERDNSLEIQQAIDTCYHSGGGRVLVPAGGTFISGPIFLKSNMELFVETGATLMASPDESLYHRSAFGDNKSEGTIWIGGDDIENVIITGGGRIHGNGRSFMGEEFNDAYELKPFDVVDPRPHLLTLIGGKNIKIFGISFHDAAYWGLHFIGCDNVSISGVSIYHSLKIRNSDGIDIDHSKNVNITNCHIESGDDCICFKNRREYSELGPCKDINITNCTMISTSCAVKFGSENVDEIKNVTISNCIIKSSNRGIGIQNRDEGSVSNILVSNVIMECRLFSDVWWGKAEPIYVTAYPRDVIAGKDASLRLPEGATKGKVGPVKNVRFLNIQTHSENGIFIGADQTDKISDIQFIGVNQVINKTTDYQGGIYDIRPCEGPGMISGNTSGFHIQRASNISIVDCGLVWGENKPDYYQEDITEIESDHVRVVRFESSKSVDISYLKSV